MNKLLAALGLSVAMGLSSALPARADAFDVNQLRCSELMEMDEDSIVVMLLWMDGYLSGVTGDTRFNPDFMENFAEKVGMACSNSPTTRVLEVAKIVGIQM